jgi:hypothetical protein
MTNLVASNTMPAAWTISHQVSSAGNMTFLELLCNLHKKPVRSNLISPYEAMATPITIADTFARVFMFAGASPRIQVAMRVTTAFVA